MKLNHYNTTNSLLVISSFPPKGTKHAANQDALASFAKNRLLGVKKLLGDKRIVVLSSIIDKPEIYEDDGVLVIRCYRRNQKRDYLTLLRWLKEFNSIKDILIEFEFASFGDTFTTGFFPAFLAAAKIMGKKITIETHQVLDNLDKINGHVGLKANSFKIKAFSFLMRSFYQVIGSLADQLIVLEGQLKDRLINLGIKTPIFVLPHGVEKPKKRYSKSKARKILGLNQKGKYILNFGFLTWYKGSDLIAQAVTKNSDYSLLLAGGASQNQKDKPHYQKFYQKLMKTVARKPNILHTDFVKESDIALYFAASDLVVLPYRTFMSSSGPLSLAITYQKPFALSRMLTPYTHSEDIQNAIKTESMEKEELFFDINPRKINRRLNQIIKNRRLINKMTRVSKILYKQRQFNTLAKTQVGIIKGNKSIDILTDKNPFLLEWNRG